MGKKIKFKIYHLFYLLPVFVIGYLLWQNTKPVLEVRCDFKKKTALCGELVPTSRVTAGEDSIVIKEEPVYFDVRLPRKYDRAEAEIEYTNLRHDLLEFGIARDEAKKNFEFVPLENKILDDLGWKKTEQDGLVLYQKNPVYPVREKSLQATEVAPIGTTVSNGVYKNITDFLANPPKFFETLVYRADLAPKFGIMSAKGNAVIDFPVRGNIKLLVYKVGAAPQVIADADSDFHKTIDNLGGGLYAINISGSEEAVFTKISVDSPYAAIADKIKIGRLDKPLTIYFAGSRLLANAHAAGGAQKIDANGQIINIEKIKEQYVSIFKNIKLRPVEIPKGEVELGGTLFFINDKNLFYPRYEPFYSGADLSKINYIITGYKAPDGVAEKIARADFNIKDIPTPGGKLRFIISLPNAASSCHSCDQSRGASAKWEGRNLVQIKSIKLKFSGEKFTIIDIWHKIFSKFSLF